YFHLLRLFLLEKLVLNDNMIKQIADTLEARELFKVSVLQNCEFDRREVAEELAKGARAEIVQVIGSTIVLYKESRENKQIKLPR
ncbi:ribosome assembly RNA-binding protein YhbY, partial [Bacillus sp. D-CC]